MKGLKDFVEKLRSAAVIFSGLFFLLASGACAGSNYCDFTVKHVDLDRWCGVRVDLKMSARKTFHPP